MADRSLLFKSDASKEVNVVQTLEPRLNQAEALGGKTVTETPVRILARDKNGNLVASPILTDILNTEFENVIRRDGDGKSDDGLWVTFATTSNDENGGVDPEKSLLVSLNDLILTIKVPNDVSTVTTEPIEELNPDYDENDPNSQETLPIEALCKYYGKPIKLDAIEEQSVLWDLVAERTVRLHKNNGASVSGKWSLDLERIEKETPDVLHLHVSKDDETLAIDLDPSKVQTIPVIFTPDDGQDVFKLLLFIKSFDLRDTQKQFKISNSTAEPAEAQFLRPWVIVSTVDDSTLTGAAGEGGKLKIEGLTNCVKAVDAEDGSAVEVTVTVIPDSVGFNTTGTLDSVKIPSVPSEKADSQLKNLVDDGLFTVKATVSADGYETQEIELSVCINGDDERPTHLTLVLDHEAFELTRTLVNGEATESTDELSCTSRFGEHDAVVDDGLTVTGVSGKDGETTKEVTTTVVNELGASSKTIYVTANDNGSVSGHILVKCECEGYVTETIKLPVKITDKRIPDGVAKWSIVWTTEPSVTIPETHEGLKGQEVKGAVISSQGLDGALVATTGTITSNKVSNQWGNEEEVDAVVVGVVDSKNVLSINTVDVVDIPENAFDNIGCWLNISILTKSGLVINKKVQATVTDSRSAE